MLLGTKGAQFRGRLTSAAIMQSLPLAATTNPNPSPAFCLGGPNLVPGQLLLCKTSFKVITVKIKRSLGSPETRAPNDLSKEQTDAKSV